MTIFEFIDSLTEETINTMEDEELDTVLAFLGIDLTKVEFVLESELCQNRPVSET